MADAVPDLLIDKVDFALSSLPEDHLLRRLVRAAVRFRVDNIFDYVLGGMKGGKLSGHISTAAPLAPFCWYEWMNGRRSQCGVLQYTVKHGDDGAWRSHLETFGSYGSDLSGFRAALRLDIAADGGILDYTETESIFWHGEFGTDAQPGVVLGHCWVPLLAVCFAHCKNVAQREMFPPRPVRRRLERAGRPAVSYRVLEINPNHPVVRHEQAARRFGDGVERALHICRGHFATYSEDKPLFGKYTGRYFIPMHTRGTLKAGAVVKDYEVKAGAVIRANLGVGL